ncbi:MULTISPECIES: hypothetical protein [Lactobacillaceae]|jgi:hypothetical protein|uniref:hypothetical protein n=1 Tax=Lactobacillaceae TaxID=33958 RepID=UPI0021A82E7A|nr:hypothetical protein [Limosilactobacillus fermentum]MCT3443730.1 hypothetical protein [Limosilactobacillus fermentum]
MIENDRYYRRYVKDVKSGYIVECMAHDKHKSLQQLRPLLKAFCVAKVVRLFPDRENVASYTKK